MATRLLSIGIDTPDPDRLGRWWAEALGWARRGPDEFGDVEVAPPASEPPAPTLLFLPVTDVKQGKNRVHLDLASRSDADQAAVVDRLLGLGATRVDIGQTATPWVVLADPEGNELCVLEPRPETADAGTLASIVLDAGEPERIAPFWIAATGRDDVRRHDGVVSLHAPERGAASLDLVPVPDPKRMKLRWHLDVVPVGGTTVEAEADRLRAAGGHDVDIGQHTDPLVDWIVLADPEGNELCVVPADSGGGTGTP
jgi:hypothetical protein